MKTTHGTRRMLEAGRPLLVALAALALSAPALAGIGDGGCAWLSGSTYLDSSAIASPTGAFTVEAWARCDSADPASQFIVSKNDDDGASRHGYYLRVNASGYAEAGIGNGSSWVTATSSFDIDQGDWNHYALVYDGTNMLFYLNGVRIGSEAVTPFHSDSYFTVGCGQYAGSDYNWTGHIDEVRYWSVARTQAEICGSMFTSFTDAICKLLLYYKFDGNAQDATRPDNLGGTGTFVSGGSGVCQSYVTLDGATDYFSSSSVLFPSKAFTVEAWARCASETPADQYIVSQNEDSEYPSGYYIRVNGDGKAEAGISDGFTWATVASSGTIVKDAWNHYAMTFDGASLEFYLNGSSVGSTTAALATSFSTFMVGRGQYYKGSSSSDYYWNGDIEEVRCWSVARTQTEIYDNMSTALSGTECGLQHYYKFDGDGNDSVETAEDLSWSGTSEYRRSGAFAGPKNALTLDGSEDYVAVADDASLDFSTGSFTLMFWIKGAAPAGDRAVIDHTDASGGYLVEVTGSGEGKLRFSDTATTLTSTAAVMDGTWHHVTVTHYAGTVYIYLDGIADATADGFYDGCTASAANPLYVGRYQSGATPCLGASLDEVRIWNYNLDDYSPIETIPGCIFRNLVGTDYGLVLYFRMDFGTAGQDNAALGTRLADHSGGGNQGTLSYSSTYPVFGSSTAFYTWIGAESSAGNPPASSRWDLPGNWSRYAVPTATDNAGLHKSPAYSPSDTQPRLNSTTGDRACHHLHVGENFYLDNSRKISVSGHFFGTSQAPFACATGTLAFVGSSR
ncbi:MAG: LamG domain-containing protein [Acidobacteria bacterium]|nr:LamG domain-containing protein [Acidobacteriota bacterium]